MFSRLNKPENKAFAGKRLSEIARMQNKDWRDAAMDPILTECSRMETTYFLMSEENVKLQLQQPWMAIGTDAGGVDPEEMKGRLVHPRAYGSFPKILGLYVREQKVVELEDAVRTMTSSVTLSEHDAVSVASAPEKSLPVALIFGCAQYGDQQ